MPFPAVRVGWLPLLLMVCVSCARVTVGEHVAATDYSGTMRRVFVVNSLDSAFDPQLPSSFADAFRTGLARCDVVATVYRPSSMQLDAGPKLAAELEAFKPDSTLVVRQTVRNRYDGEVRGGTYLLTAHDVGGKRDIWKATIAMGAPTRWLMDRGLVGPKLADTVIRQMVADGVLKSCPPFPPEAKT